VYGTLIRQILLEKEIPRKCVRATKGKNMKML